VKEFKPVLPESLLVQKAVDLDALRFVFSQVEKRVKETAEDGDRINSKSLTIIGICLTFITGLMGYVIANFSTVVFPITISAVYLIGSLAYVLDN
jgi:hypothetical protein